MESASKRPRVIRIVIWGLILLGLLEGSRVVALFQQYRLLLELSVQPDPRLRMILAAGWMVLFWGTAVALWRRQPFTRWLVPGVLLLYFAYDFALTALSARISGDDPHWLARGLLAAVVILFSTWALNRKTATLYYYVEEGRQTANMS